MAKYTAKQVQDALEEIGLDVRDDYSGRGMYGDTCPGFEVDSESEAFVAFVELADIDMEMARHLAATVRSDSMGRGMIFYWPRITYEKEAA